MAAAPSVVYVLPASSLHGGNRVAFEHAEGLQERGYRVRVVSPEPPPSWYPLRVPFEQRPVFEPGGVPRADIAIGTFYPTVPAALESGSPHVFHFCQGFEGVHREYAPILDRIDAVYRLPIPKLLVSAHLRPVLEERYGARLYLVGQAVDSALFSPGPFRLEPRPLVVGVVGPFRIRSKGIPETLRGIALAREAGLEVRVHHASADPPSPEEEALGATDRFFHHLATGEMPGFYRGLDAFIHPSHDEEGFPLPPLEAMACGIPVALAEIGSFRVLPDEAVVRFPPGRPEAIPATLEALADPARRRALRERGLACARSYTLERVLDRVEAAFRAEGAPAV